jgi:peptidoglycan/xylan/chitin deacetylase (PgdA/CDA1 family)
MSHTSLGVGVSPGTSVVGIQTEQPHVVCTYDDGPEPDGTDRVLACLNQWGATATFFVLLSRARRNPNLVRCIAASGHEIGFHGLEHRRLTTMETWRLTTDLRDGRSELQDLVGTEVHWFRPPFGSQTVDTWRAIITAGMTPVFWQLSCRDWLDLPMEEYLKETRLGARRGSILLVHDGFAGEGLPPHHDRGELARRLLRLLSDRGLVARSLRDALRAPGASLVQREWLDRR